MRYFVWYKYLDTSFFRFVTNHAFDRQTDRQTDRTEFSFSSQTASAFMQRGN